MFELEQQKPDDNDSTTLSSQSIHPEIHSARILNYLDNDGTLSIWDEGAYGKELNQSSMVL